MVILLAGAFCWYGIRSLLIKRGCATIKYIEPATPAITAISKEEAALNQKLLDQCLQQNNPSGNPYMGLFTTCGKYSDRSQERQAQPAKSAQEQTRPASNQEYQQCLREHGI